MCDCFHLAFPNWHAASSGTGPGRRLRGPEPGTEDDSTCDGPSHLTEEVRPRPQGSSPVEEYPETDKFTDSDKECEAEHDTRHKSGSGKKTKKSGRGSMFDKRSTPKMSKLKGEGEECKFKIPNLGISIPKLKGSKTDSDAPKVDVTLGSIDVSIPEQRVEVEKPELEIKPLQTETEGEHDGQGSKFKMPELGITMPKVRGPEIDLSLSKKDIHATLPKAEAQVKLPDMEHRESGIKVEVKAPEIAVHQQDVEGSPLKFKMPTFKLPKFGVGTPNISVEGPDMDKDKDVNVTLPEAKADVNLPDVELQEPSAKVEIKAPAIKVAAKDTGGSPSKFKMPSFSFSKPKVKGPVIDLSLSKKDTDITLQDTNTEVKLPEVAKIDVSLGKAEVLIPEAKVEVKKPEVQIKPQQTDVELEGQGGKFKMPKFGITMPKVKGPDFDLSFSKKDVDVTLPKAKAEVETPDTPKITVDVKPLECEAEIDGQGKTEGELDGQGSKFKMPKFGISMPKVKGPEIDFSISKKDVDISLPEAKTEINLPDVELKEPSAKVEVKAPEIEAQLGSMKGSPSKFKMPTFKFPKFGVAAPNVSAEIPDTNKEIKIDGAHMDISAPHTDIDVLEHEAEVDGQGSKFKMPKFGISMPKVTGPDIDLSLSKKDVDVTIPEAKAQVKLPDVDLKGPSAEVEIKHPEMKVVTKDKDGSPSKYKMPTFKLPKFGVGTPSSTIEVRDMEKDVKINDVDINIPEEVLAVHIVAPSIDTEGKSIDLKTTTTGDEEKGSKFKMPKFGISMPKVTGPDIDLSLSKKHVDVTIPEVKAEVKLPDVNLKGPSAEVEIQHPEMKVVTKDKEGSPSKYKMPTFKLPKFGVGTPSSTIEVPDIDKDVKINDVDINIPEEVLAVNIVAPTIDTEGKSIDLKTTTTGDEEKGSKFKLPKFGISMPKVTGPDIDLSLSKKHVDVTIPEVKAEVKLPDVDLKEPSAEVEIKPPEIKVVTKDKEGSPSKFKMPTFKFPKFGVGTPSSTIEVPDMDKDVKINDADINIPEEVLAVHIVAPSIDTEGKSMDLKTTTTGHEEKGSKFKLPSLSFVPQGPDIDSSLSKTAVDVTIPEAKADVQLPDVELKGPLAKVEIKAPGIEVHTSNVEGSPSKFKMPTFKLPKFGAATPQVSVEVPDVDKDIKVDGSDLKLPKAKVEVTRPDSEAEIDGQGGKFKMPKFGISMPKVKGPEIDLSLSKKDLDVTLPEAKAEVQLTDVEIKQPSGKVDAKAPEIKGQTSIVEGSPSKLKMPTFTLPKFGAATPKVSVQVPDVDKDIQIDGAKMEVTKEGAIVNVTAPSIDAEGLSVDVKPKESELEGSESRFKMPKFGISMPKVKGPEIDLSLSKKDGDVTLPEAKTEVKLPSFEVKEPKEVKAEMSLPDVEVKGPSGIISMEEQPAEELDGNLKKKGEVRVRQPVMEIKAPELEAEHDVQGSKFKLPKFGISLPKSEGPEVDLNASQKGVDVTIPHRAEVKLPEADVKESPASVETEAKLKDVGGSPSKFKMPTLKMPKFGGASYDVTVEATGPDKAENYGAKLEEDVTVKIKGPSIDIKTDMPKAVMSDSEKPKTETDSVGQGSPSKDNQLVTEEENDGEQNLKAIKEVDETSEPGGKQLEEKETQKPAKISEKDEHKDEKTPVDETGTEEMSPTSSIQSSDAFADVSSTMTKDTLKLESGKIHVITTNIQATPEAQHAKLLTAVQVQSSEGLPLQSEDREAASWTVEDSQTSSIQRLKDSMHSEKMRFFDGAEK
ncbi:putative neuroblast differentiation-associated protein AHNAK-like [Scophthalmus maximus]|uniref:Putative neuroblast differentiation-associated protein AHNAK-like n=1 Tax=Scophthalmus maximus TaxID=52904 RepID=A0A2U9CHM0_SCOMX|nr:putative neuroblast differentiation-associated protein AHNAK-like [Scophthalmus maximus]